jgi:uncharacterized protein YjbI with pentapeptide repeats
LAWAAVQNARTAARRHDEQTKADRQRRITESFSKATEQLASEKIEARLGGIYTLERISRESPDDDYWVVMETLTAFVREHARWKERDKIGSETFVSLYEDENSEVLQPELATDIAAVLTVIVRRNTKNFSRERVNDCMLDFRGSDLRGALLADAHLEGANFGRAHLEKAILAGAHLEGADLVEAHLEGANLGRAYLEGADLGRAYLEGAFLVEAHLEGADLAEAHLEGAFLWRAHLEGANLGRVEEGGIRLHGANLEKASLAEAHLDGANLEGTYLKGADLEGAHLEGALLEKAKALVQDQITRASGNSETTLPRELTRPEHWTRIS